MLKKDEEDQLKKIQGKEHLSKMLEQSTQLLGAQFKRSIQDGSEKDLNTSASHSDIEKSESNSDSFLSSDDADSVASNEDDARLSIEQLQAKYANMGSEADSKSEGSSAEPNMEESDTPPLALNSKLSEKEKAELKKNLEDKSLQVLDENESVESDSLSESSSEQDTEDDDEPELSSSTETKPDGLVSLFDNIEEGESEGESDYGGTSSDVDMSDAEDQVEKNSSDSQESASSSSDTKSNDVKTENLKEEQVEEKTEGVLDNEEKDEDSLAVVDVPTPSLLRGTLRIYQKQGLNWLASLYNNNTNGILADEMGLGKTIQTISLLAYLACEKHNWGPHLIIVPTSVLLNWEMEFKRFAPGFKVLTYYGSPQQRKEKRKGWNRPDAFHVCITSYQLVVHDQHSFKRKKWQYMILDEAHNIKNFRSTRWQALLNFNTERRLLLTGTPLQNNLAELWSLLYFLMPQTAGTNGGIQGFADLEASFPTVVRETCR